MLGFKRQKTFLMLTKKIEETTKILVVEDAAFQQKIIHVAAGMK